MDRRDAIKRAAMLMGGVTLSPTVIAFLNGCSRKIEGGGQNLFNETQAKIVTALSDTIIPAGKTPGASDAGVPGFIERMVGNIFTEDRRERFLDGLDQFDERSREETGSFFLNLEEEQKLKFVSDQNKLAIKNEESEGARFFLTLKNLVVVGFFTSEVGATQVLRYDEIPGEYDGCVPFEEIGRAWAT